MIRLVAYSPSHLGALRALRLSPGQEQFTSPPARLIPETETDPDSLGVTVLHGGSGDGDVVGYFVLSTGSQRDKYLPAPDPAGVALRGLSIDERVQGRGIGTAAMQQAAAFARQHFPQADHLFLVVNQRNASARKIYQKAGFGDWHERDGGEHGPQWVMRQELKL